MNASVDAVRDVQSDYPSQRTTLLNRLSLAGVIAGAGLMAFVYVVRGGVSGGAGSRDLLIRLTPFIASWLVVGVVWLWRGLGYWPRVSALLLSGYVATGFALARHGLPSGGRFWLAILPALALVFMGPYGGGSAGIVSALVYAALAVLGDEVGLPPAPSGSASWEGWIGEGANLVIVGAVMTLVLRAYEREWAQTLGELDAVRRQLGAGRERLVDLTKRLRRASSDFRTAAQVAAVGASTLDTDTLLDEMTAIVLEGADALEVHWVGLFLLEESGDAAVLRAGAGQRRRSSLGIGDRLRMDQDSGVAFAIAGEEMQIASGIDRSEGLGRTSPGQRGSEIAMPLRSGGRTLGAISLLSSRDPRDLDESGEDLEHLRAIVDQVAVCIQNAQLFRQAEAALEEADAVRRRYSADEWHRFLAGRSQVRVDYTTPGVDVDGDDFLHEARRLAVDQNQPIARDKSSSGPDGSDQDEGALVVPLRLRGRPIGTITLHDTRRKRAWTAEDVALAETVAQEIAQTLESLRLADESQRRLARERLVGEVTARIRESLDVEGVLKAGAAGIREAMGLPAVTVRLTDLDSEEQAGES